MWSAVRCEFSAKQFQQLPHILLAEGHLFPMVDHQAGDAHDLVLFPQVGEVVQVVDLGGDVRIFRGNALGRRHGHMVQDSETRICKSVCFWIAWIAARLSSSKACPGPAAL